AARVFVLADWRRSPTWRRPEARYRHAAERGPAILQPDPQLRLVSHGRARAAEQTLTVRTGFRRPGRVPWSVVAISDAGLRAEAVPRAWAKMDVFRLLEPSPAQAMSRSSQPTDAQVPAW